MILLIYDGQIRDGTMAGGPVTAKKESVTLEEVEIQQEQGKLEEWVEEGEREKWGWGRKRGKR